jgi:ubiquinone/menaquinone biosynthesis C-methylase UbiE
MKVSWNYTNLAKSYVNRPSYSEEAIDHIIVKAGLIKGQSVCDVGAGVAHLTIPLLNRGFIVKAVEPNDSMRAIGIKRTNIFKNVEWFEGTGENTIQPSSSFDLVSFGSSFNVMDRDLAMKETCRILKPKGWFTCFWNHRVLTDPLQQEVEQLIKGEISEYGYGTRREDQTEIIQSSGLFLEPIKYEAPVTHNILVSDWIDAWRSHATLQRQAGKKFSHIIKSIETLLSSRGLKEISVPYVTRTWLAQARN